MNKFQVSQVAWQISTSNSPSSMLLDTADFLSDWTETDLTEWGKIVTDLFRQYNV
jgi:hypothetical protein